MNNGAYRIIRSLTKGGMGAVYLAEDRGAFDRLCVVKQMLPYYDPTNPEERRRAEQRFQEEGRTLASLSHPGIPKIYAFFREGGRYYLVMEYIQGDNLEMFITHLDENNRLCPGKRLPMEEVIRHTIGVC
ncbi:MAG: protein kinase, partial [Chloroflexi bacterium]|nr:protein kinase [Chloroflexota bacterium]